MKCRGMTMLNFLSNSNTDNQKTNHNECIEECPTQENDPANWEWADDDEYLGEEYLKKYVDKPVGEMLEKRLYWNKKEPVRHGLKDWYEYERDHIADPLDYIGTTPDNEVRWKK